MIGLIETAIAERLSGASKLDVLGYHLRKVDSLPMDFDERLPEYITNMPAAWTVFGGLKAVTQLSGGQARVTGEFHVVVGAQNLRNERATRFGATDSEVGSYQLAEDMAGLLQGQDLGLDMEAFELVAIAPLYSTGLLKERRASLMSLSLSTRFVMAPASEPFPERAPGLGDFADFRVAWNIPPTGEVTLPAGDEYGGAFTANRVQLETA